MYLKYDNLLVIQTSIDKKDVKKAERLIRQAFKEMSRGEFSDEEIEYIVKNWGKESPNKMRSKFNCSWEAICRVQKAKV